MYPSNCFPKADSRSGYVSSPFVSRQHEPESLRSLLHQGDIHKALLLGKLLSVTRSQIYADADADSPPHDLYSVDPSRVPHRDSKASASAGHADAGSGTGDLEGAGMQGTGAPAGGAEWGVGAMDKSNVVRAKL